MECLANCTNNEKWTSKLLKVPTTYSEDSYGDGRLTVDVTLRRGAIMHHLLYLKVVLVQNNKLKKECKLITANTITNSTGYTIESSVDTDEQKFLFGPQGFSRYYK